MVGVLITLGIWFLVNGLEFVPNGFTAYWWFTLLGCILIGSAIQVALNKYARKN